MIQGQVHELEVLSTELAKATSVKDKVRIAGQIFATLAECEKAVEEFVVSGIGSRNGIETKRTPQRRAEQEQLKQSPRRFRNMNLADVVRMLLEEENGELHGSEIEARAKQGGFKSNGQRFQGYLGVALKRAGGFENIGRNHWRLNDSIQPGGRPGTAKSETKTPGKPGVSQKMKLHAWLKQHGPATRAEVLAGAGVPEGTASSYLSVATDLFENRDGKWHAL